MAKICGAGQNGLYGFQRNNGDYHFWGQNKLDPGQNPIKQQICRLHQRGTFSSRINAQAQAIRPPAGRRKPDKVAKCAYK
jgi:hypothetical protein